MRRLLAAISLAAFACLPAQAQLVTYGPGPGGDIPDAFLDGDDAAALAGISSTITVTDSFTIASFDSITINSLDHEYVGNVIITLSHGGVSVDLADRIVGNGSDMFGDYG